MAKSLKSGFSIRRGGLCGSHWQRESEARAATEFAFNGDLAAVRLHQMLDDGQAQPGAFGALRTRFVGPVQTFEDAWQIGLRNANAGVFNVNHCPPVLRLCSDRY